MEWRISGQLLLLCWEALVVLALLGVLLSHVAAHDGAWRFGLSFPFGCCIKWSKQRWFQWKAYALVKHQRVPQTHFSANTGEIIAVTCICIDLASFPVEYSV